MAIKQKKSRRYAFSYEGHKEFSIVEEKIKEKTKAVKATLKQKLKFWQKPEEPKKPMSNFIIRAGPLKQTDTKIMSLIEASGTTQLTAEHEKIIENKWMPQPKLTVYDNKNNKPLTAAAAQELRNDNKRWMPMYYQNPMQGYDYLVYESLMKNTIVGPLLWSLVKFIMGTGFTPALELRNPTSDKKADAKLIKDHEYIISNLKYIDRCMSEKSDDEGIDISFNSKIANMVHNMLGFNRSCGVYQYDKKSPIKLDPKGGSDPENFKTYKGIPTGIVDFHPRDIGIVKISPDSHKMESVQIQQINGFVDIKEMLYMWNSQHAAPIYNAKFYGGSILMPCIEPARFVRTQVSSILPAVAENMAGGLYHIFIEPQGGTESQKATEYQSIVEAAEFGTSNVFMISPDRVQYENVNFDPKITELITAFDTQIKYIIACFNLPQIGSYDEAAANHATAVEKIQLTISTAINPTRTWIGEQIAPYYNHNFNEIYGEDDKIQQLFRIKVDFEDLQVETLKERAETLEVLSDVGVHLDDEKMEEVLQIEGLQDHMVEVKEPTMEGMPGEGVPPKAGVPGAAAPPKNKATAPTATNKFKVKSDKGEKFTVKTR